MLTPALARVLTTSALAALLVVPVAPAATAGGSACVAKTEFQAVKQGWTPKRVADAFDTDGKLVSSAPFSQIRKYPRCGGGTPVIVNYERKAEGKPLGLSSKFW